MFRKKTFNNNKFLIQVNSSAPRTFEPVIRKLGGVWNNNEGGWIFDISKSEKVDKFIKEHNSQVANSQNKEYYTKFVEDPGSFNTPDSGTSEHDIQEAFELIQELFERLSVVEKNYGILLAKFNESRKNR